MSSRIRFGVFDFDCETRELRREGVLVRIQAQPAQVLAILLSNAGQVVTRETLRQSIWGTETFVDFDRGLNFCIAQIRSALGDSADSPRYVRTVPKRGYQFIAPVSPDEPVTVPTPRRRQWAFPGLAALVLIISGLLLWSSQRQAVTANVAVARFDNDTGSSEFDHFAAALKDSLIVDLTTAGAGKYSVIGNAAVLGNQRNQRDLKTIASSLKASYVVLGSVRRKQDGVEVIAQLISLPDQKHLQVMRLDCPTNRLIAAQSDLPRQIVAKFSSYLPAKY